MLSPVPPTPDDHSSAPSATSSPRPQPDTRPDGASNRKSPISDQTSASTTPAPVTLPSLSREGETLPPLAKVQARTDSYMSGNRLVDEQRLSGHPQAHPSPPPIAILSQSPSLSSSSLDRSTGPSPAPGHPSHHPHPHPHSHPYPHPHPHPSHPQPPPPPPMHMHATAAHPYAPYDPLDRRIYQYSPPTDHHHHHHHHPYRQYPPPPPIPISTHAPTPYMPQLGQVSHPDPDVVYSYPGRETFTPIYTDDAATKLSDRVRRRCFNCCTTDTSTWRRSSLNPGKVLCNKCGLFERTHSRPRPEQFPHKRGPLSSSSLRARVAPPPPAAHQHPLPPAPTLPTYAPEHMYAAHDALPHYVHDDDDVRSGPLPPASNAPPPARKLTNPPPPLPPVQTGSPPANAPIARTPPASAPAPELVRRASGANTP